MYTLLIIIHVLCCIFLVTVVLLQVGRGRGMLGFLGSSTADTLFGSRTGDVLTKATEIIAALFMITSLSLAYLSLKKTDSVTRSIKSRPGLTPNAAATQGAENMPAESAVTQKGSELVEKAKNALMEKIPVVGTKKTSETSEAGAPNLSPSQTTKSKIRYDKKGNKIVDELKYDPSGKLVGHKEITYDKSDKVLNEKDLPLTEEIQKETEKK